MKHILCYGDSNTHGYIPGGGRYDDDTPVFSPNYSAATTGLSRKD